MNHVILEMRERGLLKLSPEHCAGREKAFVLSEYGKQYAAPLLAALNRLEIQALNEAGRENIQLMVKAVFSYDQALERAMSACGQGEKKNGK